MTPFITSLMSARVITDTIFRLLVEAPDLPVRRPITSSIPFESKLSELSTCEKSESWVFVTHRHTVAVR